MRFAIAYDSKPDDIDNDTEVMDQRIFINCAGYYEYDDPGGATHRKKGRKDYLVSYNHAGKMKIKIKGELMEIPGGTVFLYAPREEQYYGQADRNPIMNYWIHFSGYGIEELLSETGLSGMSLFNIGINDEIPALIGRVTEELSEKKQNYRKIAESLLERLFYYISTEHFRDKAKSPQRTDPRISQAIAFIHENYKSRLTLHGLAKSASMGVTRFTDLFREATGQSPVQYLISYRIQKAKELMAFTSYSIKQISSFVGFDNQLYFCRVFKKLEKIPPSAYRRKKP